MRVGVLALQGDFAKHAAKLAEHEVESIPVRNAEQLQTVNALVIPGGESTTLLKLLVDPLRSTLCHLIENGLPVFATCAGLILLAREVRNPEQDSLPFLDVAITRNAYGSQRHSFIVPQLQWEIPGQIEVQEGVFIRAPRIENLKATVKTLLSLDGQPVCIQQGAVVAASFHPELSLKRSPLLDYFIEYVCGPGH